MKEYQGLTMFKERRSLGRSGVECTPSRDPLQVLASEGSGLSAAPANAPTHGPQAGDVILVHFQGWFGHKTRRATVIAETPKRYRVQYEGETATHLVPKYAVTPNTNG